jgi:rod shape-determining protein MreC
VPAVLYLANAKSQREQNPLDRALIYVSSPVQWLTAATLDGVAGLWHHYVGLVGVQADNDRLRLENARLSRDLAAREEQRIENGRLRRLIGLTEKAPEVRMVYAHVIATSPSPLFRSVRIDRGERDGVRVGAAVLNEDGVVGRIAAATGGWADVLLLVDANSSTDVLVQRTRTRARVRGTGRDVHLGLHVEFLARSADVEPGDLLITSGTGTTFPKGLRIGTVMSVERGAFGLYQAASVEPRVDFGRLESVMVVTSEPGSETSFEDRPPPAASSSLLLEQPAPAVAPAPAESGTP